MIKDGALENPKPIAIFGLHTTPEMAVCKIIIAPYIPAQVAFDIFTLTLKGKKAYAAWPEKGVDTMLVGGGVHYCFAIH